MYSAHNYFIIIGVWKNSEKWFLLYRGTNKIYVEAYEVSMRN